jgi:hypothetical protein
LDAAVLDRGSGQQEIEIPGDHALEGNERPLAVDPNETWDPGAQGGLHPCQHRLVPTLGLVGDEQVEREVRHEGEGVGGVGGLRRDERKDVVVVVVAKALLVRVLQILVVPQLDLVGRELGDHDAVEGRLSSFDLADHRVALPDLLLGCAAVGGERANPRGGLLLQPADPPHDELVEMGADHSEELHPLEQGDVGILRLGQHP